MLNHPYFHLLLAILAEVVATSALKSSAEFTRLVPSVLVVAGYATAFYFLTLALRAIPIGLAYAAWSGLGIVLITLLGALIYRQVPDLAAVLGMVLIIVGIMVIHLFSSTVDP